MTRSHQLRSKAIGGLRHLGKVRRPEPGQVPVDIASLISPLRYDVRIRADFMGFLAASEGLLDERALIEEAWRSEYGKWFRFVALARFRPWVLSSHDEVLRAFRNRVLTARDLRRSIADNGFNPRYPITLYRTRRTRTADSGVRVGPGIHCGDGSHRMAILLHLDGVIHPTQYVVDSWPHPVIDNTVRLFTQDQLQSEEYLTFIASRWTRRTVASYDQAVDAVRRDAGPDAVEQLIDVVQAHRRWWSDRPPRPV